MYQSGECVPRWILLHTPGAGYPVPGLLRPLAVQCTHAEYIMVTRSMFGLRGTNLIAMLQAYIYNIGVQHGPQPGYDKTDRVVEAVTEFAVSKAIMDGARIRHTAARDAILRLFKLRIPKFPSKPVNIFKTPDVELDVAINRPSASINKKQLHYILTTKYRLTTAQYCDIIAYASQGGEGKPAVQLLVRLSE